MDGLDIIRNRIAEGMKSLSIPSGAPLENLASDIVQAAGVKGLTETMVCQGGRPDRIAELWLQTAMQAQSIKTSDWEGKAYPLLGYSQVVFNNMKQDGEEDWTYNFNLRFPANQVEAERLQEALETAIANHPIFSVRIDNAGLQHYEEGYRTPYFSYRINEGQTQLMLRVTFNRILCDATSLQILLEDLCRAYFVQPLKADHYLNYVAAAEARQSSPVFAEHKTWMQNRYDGLVCHTAPIADSPRKVASAQACAMMVEDLSDLASSLNVFCGKYHLGVNQLFCLACSIATMDYNHCDESALTWAYMGRESADEQHIIGSLHRDIPFYIYRRGGMSCDELVHQTKTQTEQGILHSDYPYTYQAKKRSMWCNAVNVTLQPSMQEMAARCPLPLELEIDGNSQLRHCMLDIEVTEQPLHMMVYYSVSHYEQSSIERYISLIRKNIEQLVIDQES